MATQYVTVALPQVTSTQDEARTRFAAASCGVPHLVVAGTQTEGRGRSGRGWIHATRAMAASLALEAPWPSHLLSLIPLVTGLAARDAVAARYLVEPSLKWPNDLLVGDDKVGGILVEASDGVVVIGCGINLCWPDAPEGMAGLVSNDPGPDAPVDLAHDWAERLLGALATPADWGRDRYLEATATIGRPVEWDPAGEGVAIDIDESGGLVVATADGTVTLRSGEVRHLRPRQQH